MSCWCFAFLFRCISLVRHFVALSGKKTRRDFSPTLLDIWSYLSKQYEFPWNSKPIIYHHYFKYFVKSTPHDLLFPAEKRGNLKRKVVFQPSCLRGYVYFRESTKKMRIEQFFVPIVCCLPFGKKTCATKNVHLQRDGAWYTWPSAILDMFLRNRSEHHHPHPRNSPGIAICCKMLG